MLVLDPPAASARRAPLPLPPDPGLQPQAPVAPREGVVLAVDGELVAIEASGDAVRLAPGDGVAPGDVLITRAGSHALVGLGDASVSMHGDARAEILAAGDGRAHVVVHDGAFVVAAEGPDGEVTIETGAAIVTIAHGSLAFRYGLEAGLDVAPLPGAATADVRVVNGSGVHLLDKAAPGFAVAHWSERPEPLSTAPVGGEPGLLQPDVADVVPVAAETGGQDDGDPSPGADAGGAEPDAGADFETGAGTAEDGDANVVMASPATEMRGLADLTHAAPPLPAFAAEPAFAAPPPRAVPSAPDHAVDALYLWQPPVETPLGAAPPPPQAPVPPHLKGWEPSGRTWETAGYAWVSGGEPERPVQPHRPLLEIRPPEGQSMAALMAGSERRADLERFLGLEQNDLNGLADPAVAEDGSAMRTSFVLKAGQTLVFDALFDADEPVNSNDFAAFTVSHGGTGEAFVLSSIAATGSFGVSPWQAVRYTAGAAGTYTIGFVVVNDRSADGQSLLYVDRMRNTLDPAGLEVVAQRTDAFGGRFELYAPDAGDEGSEARLITGFESRIDPDARIGQVSTTGEFTEPDGCRSVYAPTEGVAMAVLQARGGMRPAVEDFLGLERASGADSAFPADVDGSPPSIGAAIRLTVAVAAGDRISFDWMFDAGGRLPENDFAVFAVSGDGGSRLFKLADVRATGDAGATGWRTSVYTAAGDEELSIGFAVVNDWGVAGPPDDPRNSRLLVDNVWLNRDFAEGYQLADLPGPGEIATVPTG